MADATRAEVEPTKCPECGSESASTTVYHQTFLRQYDRIVDFTCGSKMYRFITISEWDNGERRSVKADNPYWSKLEDQTKECLYRALQNVRRLTGATP